MVAINAMEAIDAMLLSMKDRIHRIYRIHHSNAWRLNALTP